MKIRQDDAMGERTDRMTGRKTTRRPGILDRCPGARKLTFCLAPIPGAASPGIPKMPTDGLRLRSNRVLVQKDVAERRDAPGSDGIQSPSAPLEERCAPWGCRPR